MMIQNVTNILDHLLLLFIRRLAVFPLVDQRHRIAAAIEKLDHLNYLGIE